MQEQIVTFETAKLAKEKGYVGMVFPYYSECLDYGTIELNYHYRDFFPEDGWYICSSPAQSLLQKWLRDEHNTHINIYPHVYPSGLNWLVQAIKWDISMPDSGFIKDGSYEFGDNGEYESYESALEKGLFEALKLIL